MRPVLLTLLLILVKQTVTQDLSFTILHNNDMHSRFEETSRNSGTCKEKTNTSNIQKRECLGGFARTAHVIRKYRNSAAEGRANPVLYLNAGDTYVGTPWFTVHKWRIALDFMNALQPDATSVGNHEFDYGPENLAPFVDGAKFPVLAANLDFSQEPSLKGIKKSVVLTVDGEKIGIVGHVTPDTQLMSQPGGTKFLDVIKSVTNETEALAKLGIKIIIVLGHSGYDMDKKIAAEVPLADVVIGGHTNTFLWNGPSPDVEKPEDLYPKVITQANGKKVPVVQAYAYTKYMGLLNVTFNSNGDLTHFMGQPILLDTDVPQEPDILNMLEKYRPEIDALDKKVVGSSPVILDASNDKCRKTECNFGNLIADALVYYMNSQSSRAKGWTETPIALVNGGSIRTTIDPSIRQGNITRGELLGTLPFDNAVVALTVTGAALIKSLETGIRSNGETSRGEFLQVSGLQVVYDMSKPTNSRVASVSARCGDCRVPVYEPVVHNKTYRLVTFSFLSEGGDAHYALRDSAKKQVQDLGDVDLVSWYLSEQSPVIPEEQGRIRYLESSKLNQNSSPSGQETNTISQLLLLIILGHQLFQLFN